MFGHPKGLMILFFTELWERFSYYGMRAILVLYIYSSVESGGLGWTRGEALELYGWYTMLVYVMSIPGGIVADRFLGQKKTVMLGGLLLCIGHGVLAIEALWAFYTGLALIVLGVGGLKPNISTMVGGLYEQGDPRRDKGFTIFYIGINVGAFAASIIVGYVGETIGWHYGFGLAGIGMLLGQAVFVYGQRYLREVGNYIPPQKVSGTSQNVPLTKEEKDRIVVLVLSFLIIIVFWGAFEQAGGLMNIYAKERIDRDFFGLFEIPASVFQAVNAFFIMTFGTAVAGYWVWHKRKQWESSSIFKMALGTMIMGFGFVMMGLASVEAGSEEFGKAALYWLVLAYFLHTIGELCASPVALSFITKLAPARYAAIMMGIYFASTGLGNKVAGLIGESAQSEPTEIAWVAPTERLALRYTDVADAIQKNEGFDMKARIFAEGDQVRLMGYQNEQSLDDFFAFSPAVQSRLVSELNAYGASAEQPLHASIAFSKSDQGYIGNLIVFEIQNEREFTIFMSITGFTTVFGLLLLVFLPKLKKMTHGAEKEFGDQ
ncbi:MAG: peptide MFS transporter [Bernardetiaceae bacterium]